MSRLEGNIIAEEREMKFVVVGDDSSGKTSFINACVGEAFSVPNRTQLIDYKSVSFKWGNKILRMNFWDTPRLMNGFGPTPYYRGADGIFLIVDGTTVFDERKTNDIINSIRRDNPNPMLPIAVVVTKLDLKPSKRSCVDYALRCKFPTYHISAKNNVGIDETLLSFVELSLKKSFEQPVDVAQTKNKERCQ
ncbi:hypothetical protein EIN_406050 [Entamoeba invadens IP1]|uniref:Uncharacterized protein n=1 Tax=Entamoeba invadens IP1 TaxID=370355 RepID=A0A0A1UAE1_ENTIV|nr:hypothetical protein EIN_406050 [Entamoeba invadens IP1]ELP90151.1 hypothetical protein EIN_406050 [Entamoeba invadens IP1]|eukprot:XP_004256922.1 hypothetical protein EIN_406050 [Entamoeba invadens IP1]